MFLQKSKNRFYGNSHCLFLGIMIDARYNLEYSESTRTNRQGEKESLLTDWYLSRDFTDSGLRPCNLDKYDEVSNYRLDRIADIRLLSTPVKEQAKVKG